MKTETEINKKIQELFKEIDLLNEAKEQSIDTEAKIFFAERAITNINQIEALQWVMIEGVEL